MLHGKWRVVETRFTTLSLAVLLERKIQPDEIDSTIVAELANQQNDPIMYRFLIKNIVHGPCGEHNLAASCMKNGTTKMEDRALHN